MAPDPDGIGRRIKELRIARGRSQADLTGPGLSAGYLSMIESGQRPATPAVLARLADLLGTTADYLATGVQTESYQEVERRLLFAEMALHNRSAGPALAAFDGLLADVPEHLVGRVRLGRARALEILGLLTDAVEEFQALARAAEVGGAQWAERHMDLARCYSHAGQNAASIEVGERALETFERLGLTWTDETIRLGVTLAGVYNNRGDSLSAAALLRRLLEAAEAMGSPLARGSVLWNSAIVAADTGRPGDAAMLAERALALLGESGHQRNLATLRTVYGQYLALADPDQAGTALVLQQEALDSLLEVDNAHNVSWAEVHLAVTALRAGETDLARGYALSAAERIHGMNDENESAAYLSLAETELAVGDGAAARRAADSAAEILLRVKLPPRHVADKWNRLAALREELGDAAGALAAYRQAMQAAGFAEPKRAEAPARVVER